MRGLICFALGLAFPAMIAPAVAGETLDAANRAKVIAPFVDEQTLAVVHFDLSRVAIEPLAARLAELLPDAKEDLAAAKSRAAPVLAGLLRAGAKEVYIVFTLALGPPQQPAFGVIPLQPGSDEKAILASLPNRRAAHRRVGEALLVFDRQDAIDRARELKADPRPGLGAAFEAAGDTAVQVLLLPPSHSRRVIEETMPELPKQVGGGPSTIFTRGVLWAVAAIDLPPKAALRVVVQSQDAQAAAALKTKWAEIARLVGQWKEVRAAVPNFDRAVALLSPKVEGDRLTVAVRDDDRQLDTVWSACGSALGAATQGARQAASRSRSTNNLKQLGLAMHVFHDVHKSLPPHARYSPDGKPLLSWRVLILPHLDQDQLHGQFRLDEPWDSPHNRTLIDKMPPFYRSPGSKLKEKGRTNYVVVVGPETVFSGREGTPLTDIKDGASNTIMIVECDDQRAPIWTKPDDLPFDSTNPAKGLGRLYERRGFNAVFCDGSVRFLTPTMPPEKLRALFTKAGGEPVGD